MRYNMAGLCPKPHTMSITAVESSQGPNADQRSGFTAIVLQNSVFAKEQNLPEVPANGRSLVTGSLISDGCIILNSFPGSLRLGKNL